MGFFSSLIGSTPQALTNAANSNVNNTQALAGQYGAGAGQIMSNISPVLTRWATGGAPGYGPMGTAQMLTRAQLATGANTGANAEQARLAALRTGNMAALPAAQTAIAQGGARAAGDVTQNVLAQNEQLKQQQQAKALSQLSSLYGTDVEAQTKAQGMMPQALDEAYKLRQPGFLTNLAKMTGDIASIGADVTGFGPMMNQAKGMFGGGGGDSGNWMGG